MQENNSKKKIIIGIVAIAIIIAVIITMKVLSKNENKVSNEPEHNPSNVIIDENILNNVKEKEPVKEKEVIYDNRLDE